MCINVDLKIYVLLQLVVKFKSNVKIDSKYEVVEKILCERGNEKWYKKDCIQRECVVCGIDGVVFFFILFMREILN